MNKKVLVIALVLVLAVGSVFAAKKADVKAGVQLGYGADSLTLTGKGNLSSLSTNVLHSGFYGAFTFEYGLSEDLSFKAEAGVNTMGKAKATMKSNSGSYENNSEDENTPINFTVFAGAIYNIELNKQLSAYVGGGVDMLIGKLSSAEDAETNAAIGIGAEAGVSYAIDKKLSINAGGKFGWHFVNTNADVEDSKSGDNYSTTNISYKFYAGATYAL
jgi:opacity protein-like surface antigen